MLERFRFTTAPSGCSYLPGETAQMSYRLIHHLTTAEYEQMLLRGWRRFGNAFFRPNCPACAKCRSLRVPLATFAPSKSQRRALKKNAEIRLEIHPPSVTPEHVRLYNEYHAFMALERGWKDQPLTEAEYQIHFIGTGFPFAREFRYYLGAQLVGIGLVDIAHTVTSSLYFYHDPAHRDRALGVFSMLKELEYARDQAKTHHLLGYWIAECPSSRYKGDYRPFELLLGFPPENEHPLWVSPGDWQPILNQEPHGLVLE